MPEEETTTHGRTAAVPVADPSPVAATRPGGSASRGPTRLVVLLGALTAFSPLAVTGLRGRAEPMRIFSSSAVRSPISRLYLRLR